AASSVWRTNVWRMFQALYLQGNTQAAKYDDGVGTSSFIPLAILGGAFGYGLKRNILDAYKFICRNYDHQHHSKIYLFGFALLLGAVLSRSRDPIVSHECVYLFGAPVRIRCWCWRSFRFDSFNSGHLTFG